MKPMYLHIKPSVAIFKPDTNLKIPHSKDYVIQNCTKINNIRITSMKWSVTFTKTTGGLGQIKIGFQSDWIKKICAVLVTRQKELSRVGRQSFFFYFFFFFFFYFFFLYRKIDTNVLFLTSENAISGIIYSLLWGRQNIFLLVRYLVLNLS